ncbi:hypothetical protein C3B44_04115 [Corynebacterium yudongzhengii]|uniref:Na+/H+ antiporter subunit C n=1 Tax=Corynebacterium yudongzhengii TaxID=2080740 RepID=A0A2U1T6N4_9CORY|nr:cation:proton antiporter subunit C [Corynebacterium yudongzhengii]AWB81649.1 hypothetical protein C3B44_04115 [Corynebacterium yudongzhengii]PWC01548.1 hypothetical protein DF222_07060 [Corynebacterium yudongzhengii]
MTLALSAALLMFGGVYLMMRREMLRIVLGFMLLSHAANLVLMAAGGTAWRDEPFGTHQVTDTAADPLPQAFVLTAIVISFSISVVMLVTAVVGKSDDRTRTADSEKPADDKADRKEVNS